MSTSRIVDLSYPLDPGTPVYPNYPGVEIQLLESTRQRRVDGRRALNSSRISLGLHCGTHMDAPFHFFEEGWTVNQVPLEQCTGAAWLVDVKDAVPHGTVEVNHLAAYREKLRELRKLILNTGWASRWGSPEYFSEHPVLSPEAAALLVESGVHLVGVDMPSIDRSPFPSHVALLGSGAVIVENLANLDRIGAGPLRLVVLPLAITARDASPVRAIAQLG